MKISAGSVAMNVPPFDSIALSGPMTKLKMSVMKKKEMMQPTTRATTHRISRFRSSSRCSRNDILPPASSSSASVSSM